MESSKTWDKSNTTIADMDNAVAKLRELKTEYEAKKKESDNAYHAFKDQQNVLIEMLEALDRKGYEVDGVGKVTVSEELSVPVPKTVDEKRSFFNWLAATQGEDFRDAYLTVHSATLNRLYKELSEEYSNRGEVLDIPGLNLPQTRKKISFRKK